MINDELEIGKKVYKYLTTKDYDGASLTCLKLAVLKVQKGDFRNAALIIKKMFDVMMDDVHLLGLTKDIPLLKDCSMISNFLNATFCLYGNRYEEAIGYANLVLSRRRCLEAMFIKERALFSLKKYNEAYDVNFQLMTSQESAEKNIIDQKQYLLEAKINEQIGNSNIPICKNIIKLCPECITPYVMIRKEAQKKGFKIVVENDNEEDMDLVSAFNDDSLSNKDFQDILVNSMRNKEIFIKFKKQISKIEIKQ